MTTIADQPVSYAPEIKVFGDDTFYRNGLRFATAEEAEQWARDRMNKWMAAEAFQVTPATDPVTARITHGVMEHL